MVINTAGRPLLGGDRNLRPRIPMRRKLRCFLPVLFFIWPWWCPAQPPESTLVLDGERSEQDVGPALDEACGS